jgi:hypothetical protein
MEGEDHEKWKRVNTQIDNYQNNKINLIYPDKGNHSVPKK